MFIRLTVTAAFLSMSSVFTTVALAAENKPVRSGEEVFKQSCSTCHAVNFPNAPQVHDTTAWKKKYEISATQAKAQFPALGGKDLEEKTMDILVSKVRNGNHAMPPKGLCNDCTDQEYQNAIEFMSSPKK